MLGFYNLSLQGTSHIKINKVCQDASIIKKLSNGWIISVIADGVGSAKHSEVGSTTAVNAVVEFISDFEFEEWNTDVLIKALKDAYQEALNRIIMIAEKANEVINDYDTTLTAAIYNGTQIVYSHVGDGGIVTISEEGQYAQLTTVQKGEEFNCVQPLRNEKSWYFNISDDNICAFAMFTDGIYDVVCPWLLANMEQKIYINYVRLFMDMNVISAESAEDFELLKLNAEKFLNSDFNSNITDDKTVAVVVNTEIIPPLQSEEYYNEPDWNELNEENKKNLYSLE